MFYGCFFVFKQKTAYEMRISDWSSDVCSSDLPARRFGFAQRRQQLTRLAQRADLFGAHAPCHPLGRAEQIRQYRHGGFLAVEIGSASCRERVCPYVSISVVAVSLKKT